MPSVGDVGLLELGARSTWRRRCADRRSGRRTTCTRWRRGAGGRRARGSRRAGSALRQESPSWPSTVARGAPPNSYGAGPAGPPELPGDPGDEGTGDRRHPVHGAPVRARPGRRASFGLEAADVLGLDRDQVFKTLVVIADGKPAVAIVPVELPALVEGRRARPSARKRVEMCDVTLAERTTGYVARRDQPVRPAQAAADDHRRDVRAVRHDLRQRRPPRPRPRRRPARPHRAARRPSPRSPPETISPSIRVQMCIGWVRARVSAPDGGAWRRCARRWCGPGGGWRRGGPASRSADGCRRARSRGAGRGDRLRP